MRTRSPVPVRPLDAPSFAPFGAVIAAGGAEGRPVNQGRALRFDADVAIAHRSPADRLAVSTYRVSSSTLPLAVELVERHPFSDQLFVPMTARSYLVAVVPSGPGGAPDWDAARAFLARPDQAILYRAGIWHYPLAALGATADFHMCMWESGLAADTETADAPPGLMLVREAERS
ncbi:ureidoglycolate lyase [Prosthecomicrobium sp. N25]|uniref:ureidoglycolate lyase n=1 Tax=Prosthecomicrobium sp. N25 TaxID=3129254 RepID=UPI003077D96E